MDINAADNNTYTEITIQRFLLELWHEKVIIAAFTIIVFLAAVLFTYFTSETVYKSKALIAISPITALETKYGTYKLPLTTVDEYANFIRDSSTTALTIGFAELDMSEDQLLDYIKINVTKGVNYFSMTVESDTAEGARNIAEKHLVSFTHTIEMLIRNMAVDYYINRLNAQVSIHEYNLDQTETIITYIEEYLKSIPVHISEQSLNPQYEKMSGELALLKMKEESTRIQVETIESDLKDLSSEKLLLAEGRGNIEYKSSIPRAFDELSGIVTVINQPDLGDGYKTGKMFFSMLAGMVFGLMLGVFAARFKTYISKA